MKKQSFKKLHLACETLVPLQSLDGVCGGQAQGQNATVTVCPGPGGGGGGGTITVCSVGFTLPVCCGAQAPGGK
jgi:hypothetical protein